MSAGAGGSEIQVSCLRASSTSLEVSRSLQAIEVIGEGRIQRGAGWLEDLINERIHGNGTVPRIEDGGTNEPHRSSIRAAHILLAFRRAWRAGGTRTRETWNGIGPNLGTLQEVKLVGGLNDRGSIQAGPVDRSQGRQHLTACCVCLRRIHEPEVSDDPHAQQVVAEVTERAARAARAGVNGVPIARKPPILPEVRSGHVGKDVTTRIRSIAHAKAG